jgi:hypothetical protein
VLANSKQEKESNDDKIGEGVVFGIKQGAFMCHDVLKHRDRWRKLGTRGRVLGAMTVEEACEAWAELGSDESVLRVCVAGQNKGLGNMAQGCGNGLTSDLLAMTKSSSTDFGSESHENVHTLLLGDIDEEFVEGEAPTPGTPMVPMTGSGGTWLHKELR